MSPGRYLYGADVIFKRHDTRLDAGGSRNTGNGFPVFHDIISAHAAADGEHYFRYGASFGGRYEITDENRTAGKFH